MADLTVSPNEKPSGLEVDPNEKPSGLEVLTDKLSSLILSDFSRIPDHIYLKTYNETFQIINYNGKKIPKIFMPQLGGFISFGCRGFSNWDYGIVVDIIYESESESKSEDLKKIGVIYPRFRFIEDLSGDIKFDSKTYRIEFEMFHYMF